MELERETLSVLIADDDPEDRDLYRTMLMAGEENQYSIIEVDNSIEAEKVLESTVPDCVLLDYRIPPTTGLELLVRLKQRKLNSFPIVMITGQGSEETAVLAMKHGVQDYLIKDHLTEIQLGRAITNATNVFRLNETVKAQGEVLLEIERERVMMESVGAACHHLSQPMTTILANLGLLLDSESIRDPRDIKSIRSSYDAAERMTAIIHKLQEIRKYRTIPYTEGSNILDIEKPSMSG